MIIALAGLPGAGKTTAARILKGYGFHTLRFGDVTEIELKKAGLEINEKNERFMREKLRKDHGMGAYAVLNIERIRNYLQNGKVVIDGMRSWEEFVILNKEFGSKLKLVAIDTSAEVRHERLGVRSERGLTKKEAESRDKAEIENLGVDEPVKKAPTTINNNGSMAELKKQIKILVSYL